LKCWAIFKHGQARRQSVLGLGRAFCAGREVTNTPGATEWYRAATTLKKVLEVRNRPAPSQSSPDEELFEAAAPLLIA